MLNRKWETKICKKTLKSLLVKKSVKLNNFWVISLKMQNKLLAVLKERQKKVTDRPKTMFLIKLKIQKVWLKVQKERLNRTSDRQRTKHHKKLNKQKTMFQKKLLMLKRWPQKPKIKVKICTTELRDMLLKRLTK